MLEERSPHTNRSWRSGRSRRGVHGTHCGRQILDKSVQLYHVAGLSAYITSMPHPSYYVAWAWERRRILRSIAVQVNKSNSSTKNPPKRHHPPKIPTWKPQKIRDAMFIRSRGRVGLADGVKIEGCFPKRHASLIRRKPAGQAICRLSRMRKMWSHCKESRHSI